MLALSAVVGLLLLLVVIALCTNQECSESTDGGHAWVHASEPIEGGTRWFLRCLDCGIESRGWSYPTIRRWIHPSRTNRHG